MSGRIFGAVARATFSRRMARSDQPHLNRISTWRDLSIDLAVEVNPFSTIPLARNLGSCFEPIENPPEDREARIEIRTTDGRTTVLARVATENEGVDLVYRSLPGNGQDGDLDAPEDVHSVVEELLGASRQEFDRGEWLKSAQHALNCFRILQLAPGLLDDRAEANLRAGLAFAEMGEFEWASRFLVLSARRFGDGHREQRQAETLEIAGLAMGRLPSARDVCGQLGGTIGQCFREAGRLFGQFGDFCGSSRCFVMEQDFAAGSSTSRWRRSVLRSFRLLWLYGQSPIRAILSLGSVWIVSAFLFMYGGFKDPDAGRVVYSFTLDLLNTGYWKHLATCAYLSAATVFTVGFGDVVPSAGFSRVVAGLEGFAGVVLAAMLLVAMQRRYLGR